MLGVAGAVIAACGSSDADVVANDAGRIVPVTMQPPVQTSDGGVPTTVPGVDTSMSPTTAPPETTPPTTVATTTTVPPDPLPPIAQIEQVPVALQPVTELEIPVAVTWRPGDPAAYIIGQSGYVWRVDETGAAEVVLDFTARVTPFADGSERGLLGVAFGPDGRIFLNFTDLSNNTNVVSMAMNGVYPDPATERQVLFVEQPGLGHNGGTLAFDDAGNLYVAMGDGGGSNGLDAQDPTKLLGTILRIRPLADAPGYEIPPDNPFVGHPEIRPEKWVFGFRNPWKFSIDDDTGDLWLGDVGNSSWEEIDQVTPAHAGMNFGWYWFEGTHQRRQGAPPDVVPPVWEYSHDVGVAVIGGLVYRGTALPGLRGAYVFGDITGILWALGSDGVHRLPVSFRGVAGFGEDPNGEIWLVSIWGDVARLT